MLHAQFILMRHLMYSLLQFGLIVWRPTTPLQVCQTSASMPRYRVDKLNNGANVGADICISCNPPYQSDSLLLPQQRSTRGYDPVLLDCGRYGPDALFVLVVQLFVVLTRHEWTESDRFLRAIACLLPEQSLRDEQGFYADARHSQPDQQRQAIVTESLVAHAVDDEVAGGVQMCEQRREQ